MIRKSMPSGDEPMGGSGFPSRKTRNAFARRSCSNKKIERDDDSKKSHHALEAHMNRHQRRAAAKQGNVQGGSSAQQSHVAELIAEGVRRHQAGQLPEAEKNYRL